jgi:hypothetical protein
VSIVGEFEPAGVAQHVRVDGEGQVGGLAGARHDHAQLLEVIGPPRSEANTLGFDRRQNLPDRTFCRAATRGSLLPPRAAHEVHRVMSNVKQPACTIKTPPDHPKHREEVLDEAIEETFPASDPVSVTIDRSPEERGQPSKLDRLDEARKREEEEKR